MVDQGVSRGLTSRVLLGAMLLVFAALALPGPADAETITLGYPALPAPEALLALCAPCTVLQTGEPGATVVSPVDGTVTAWRYQSGDAGAEYQLEVLHPEGGSYSLSGRSPAVTVPDANGHAVREVTLALPLAIAKGDSVALHVIKGADVPTSGTGTASDTYGEFSFDAPGTPNHAANQQVLLQATVVAGTSGGAGNGGGGTGSGGAVPPPSPPPPTVALSAPTPKAAAGRALMFEASVSALAGQRIAHYEYSFTGGAKAKCEPSYPVLSAVFLAAASGTATLTAVTSTGVRSVVSSVPFTVTAPSRGKLRAKHAGAIRTVGGLAGYTCSATQASAPSHTSFGETVRCIYPSVSTYDYVEIVGCLSQVSFAELPADRGEAPLGVVLGRSRRFPATEDSTGDTYLASRGEVQVNGLLVTPESGHSLVLGHAAAEETLLREPNGYYLFSGGAKVSIASQGVNATLPISTGAFTWDVSLASKGKPRENGVAVIGGVTIKKVAEAAIPGLTGVVGKVIEAIPPGAIEEQPDLNTPVTGRLGFMIRDGRGITSIPINVTNLPLASLVGEQSGLHVDVTVTTENDPAGGRPKLGIGDFKLNIPHAFIGPLGLENINVHYSHAGDSASGLPPDSLSGSAEAVIGGGKFDASVLFSSGKIRHFHIGFLGSQQLVPPQVFLTKASVDLSLPRVELTGDAHVSVFGGAIADGCGVSGANGKGTFTFEPFLLSLSGAPEVLCIPSPAAPGEYFFVNEDGYVAEGAYIDFELPGVGFIKGNLGGVGYFNFKDFKFHMRFDGSGSVNAFGLGASAQLLVSDEGVAACTEVGALGWTWHPGVGASYDTGVIASLATLAPPVNIAFILHYLATKLDFKSDGCDVNKYAAIPSSHAASVRHGARAAASPQYSFTVPPKERAAIVLLHGAGGAPGAILRGPGGRTVEAPAGSVVNTPTELVIHLAQANETEIELAGKNAGAWTVEPLAGGPPIESAELSSELTPPKIRGRVTGSGAKRVLHYTARNIPRGTRVTFVEEGTGDGKALGVASAAHGTLHFTPSFARTGSRTIVALLQAGDGAPRPALTVTRYTASPPRPSAPTHLHVRHIAGTVRITFSPSHGASKQYLTATLSDGRTPVYVLGPSAHSVTIARVPKKVRVQRVAVRGAAHGLLSAVAKARVR